ncbi:MAG: putative serine/threonine protein kinase, partial [Cyanobacteria bacterium RYN_339]|nr:putative serine/threonine protein kinase [Cyanobacteria bacterium RYN_339]
MSFSPAGHTVLGPLGQGTTSTVYRVRREADGALLALKRLELPGDAARVMFRHEFWRLKRLAHPNLVAAHDLGQDDGRDFFTQDLVDGPALPAGPVGVEELRAVLVPLARALGYLHARGLVHGDLKAENLRFDAEGRLRLLDLGFLAQAGRPGQRRGTLEYMAPEVIKGAPVDPRSDLYAVGVLAYQLLAGRLPFVPGPGGPLALLQAQLETSPPPLVGVPAAVAEAVMGALAKDVGDRPPSASHLLARLGWGEAEAAFVGFGATLVGRDAALATARAQLEGQLAGEAGALVLAGAPGVGKSRLLAALAAPPRLALAASGGDDVPYRLVTELLEGADRLLADAGLAPSDERWRALRALMPAWGAAPAP